MKLNDWAAELPVSITVCDKKGIITYVNDKSRKTFSSDTDDELIGMNLKDCHSPESTAKLFHLIDTRKVTTHPSKARKSGRNGLPLKANRKDSIAPTPFFRAVEI